MNLHQVMTSTFDSSLTFAKNILRDLIGLNTTSSPNAALAQDTTKGTDYVAALLRDENELGATEVHVGEPYEFPPGSGKMHKSLVAVWMPEHCTNPKPLAFSSHIDVVAAPGTWKGHNPFMAREVGDKIIGRGAVDMKGQLASLLGVLKNMHKNNQLKHLNRPLMLMLSSCEEVGTQGALDVCTLAKKHNLIPDEIIVTEPTDGYIGLGGKGVVQEEINFARIPGATPSGHVWPHYFTITVQSQGGHSSLQSATLADPAIVALDVQRRVKELRRGGVPIEICDIRYGTANNIVGGKATITVGYKDYGYSRFKHYFECIKARVDNIKLRAQTIITNAFTRRARELTGMDSGDVSLEVTKGSTAQKEYPMHVVKTQDGLQSDSAIEHALETAGKIYALHSEQRDESRGRPEGYVLPPMGLTSLATTMLNGNSDQASLWYDLRYPMEAMKKNDLKIENVDSIVGKIHATAADGAFDTKITRHSQIAPYEVADDDPRIEPYQHIVKDSGFKKYRTTMTNLPFTSDGNTISAQFPDALVLTMASGGFANLAHGAGEYVTHPQLRKNVNLYDLLIARQAMPGKATLLQNNRFR